MQRSTDELRILDHVRSFGRWLERSVRRRLPNSFRTKIRRFFLWALRRPLDPVKVDEGQPNHKTADRGTILIVAHDAEVGGAQQVARVFARWLLERTRYEVKFAVMRGGGLIGEYAKIAPVIDISSCSSTEAADRLHAFAGDDVRAIVINSVASGGFLRHWTRPTPVIAFVHELTKLLQMHSVNLELIKQRASLIIAGSEAVARVLCDECGCDDQRVRVVHGFVEDDLEAESFSIAKKFAAKEAIGLEPDVLLVTACGVAHWRKSPETFVQVAKHVLARTTRRLKFVWIGDGPDRTRCEALARKSGVAADVTFTGYEPNIHRFLRASDIFLLPSEEDPFPLVCLYAGLALNPVICFAGAGGMPELVASGGGRVVPFGDVAAMAEATLAYLNDPAIREADARAMREKVVERHTVAIAGPCLLYWIREAAGLRPHISVVVPSYNYARFLGERLASLQRQTYQDFEVLLLDDCSNDDSVPLLQAWGARRAGTRIVVNDVNTGTPFLQWLKGIEMSRGELVWIAEADDTCAPELLATLVPAFDDRNTFLGYVKSTPIDAHGTVLGDYESLYLDRIASGRWSKAYLATDHEEANTGLGIANCIPNASSVLFRHFHPEPEFTAMLSGMRLCGDWLFYLRAMRGGMVAYRPEALNMHRRHDDTVTHGIEGTPRYFDECETVRSYAMRTYRLTPDARRRIGEFIAADERRFGAPKAGSWRPATMSGSQMPAVLFVASDLSPGGGQMFMIRLANAWAERGGRAVIFNAAKFPDHPRVIAKISPRVPIFTSPRNDVADLVTRFGIDLIHSAIWWADVCALAAAERHPRLPWVITMHGCHETLLETPTIDGGFSHAVSSMLRRADAWVHTADKNERLFATYGRPFFDVRIENGVVIEPGPGISREHIGIADGAMVVCLASRAIPEKGWTQAVEAVARLRSRGRHVELLLIGDGPAADEIRRLAPEGVRLIGHVSNLQDFLAVADVVILPSYFVGESMPLVVLEAMAVGKPIIATCVGDIPEIIGSDRDAAGLLIPLVDGRPDVDMLASALESLFDPVTRKVMGSNGRARFESRYTLATMAERYRALYWRCIETRRNGTNAAA